MNLSNTFFIISVYQAGLTAEVNEANHDVIVNALTEGKIQFKSIVGRFEGIDEESVLVYGIKNEGIIKEIMKSFNQKAYLTVYQDLAAELVHSNGLIEQLGSFVKVSLMEAEANNAFTIVNGQAYICKKGLV